MSSASANAERAENKHHYDYEADEIDNFVHRLSSRCHHIQLKPNARSLARFQSRCALGTYICVLQCEGTWVPSNGSRSDGASTLREPSHG